MQKSLRYEVFLFVYLYSCIITCDSGGPLLFEFYHMYSNLQRQAKKNHDHAKYWFKKLPYL